MYSALGIPTGGVFCIRVVVFSSINSTYHERVLPKEEEEEEEEEERLRWLVFAAARGGRVEDFFPHCWRGCRRRRRHSSGLFAAALCFSRMQARPFFFAHRTAKIGELPSLSLSLSVSLFLFASSSRLSATPSSTASYFRRARRNATSRKMEPIRGKILD